jgi:hypothetical protein
MSKGLAKAHDCYFVTLAAPIRSFFRSQDPDDPVEMDDVMHEALTPGVAVLSTVVTRHRKLRRSLSSCGLVVVALAAVLVPLRPAGAASPTTGAYFMGTFTSPVEGPGYTYSSSSVTATDQGGGGLVFQVTSPSDTYAYSLRIQSTDGQTTGQPIAPGN